MGAVRGERMPAASTGSADATNISVSVPLAPVIQASALNAVSHSTCAGSSGSATIGRPQVGSTVIVGSAASPAPNTTITLPGGGSVVLSEQLPVAGASHGLVVNAVHVRIPGPLGLLGLDVTLASARSDIHNCP